MVEGERKRLPVRVSSAVLIEDEGGKLLLLQQAAEEKGYKWGPPAGRMNSFEDPMMTAIRETREETNVEIELIDIVGIYPVRRGEHATSLGFVFRGKIKEQEIKLAKGEIKNYRFFSLEEINELQEQDKLYRPEYNIPAIIDWRKGKSYPLGIIKSINLEEIPENPQNRGSGGRSGVFQ